MPADGKEFVKRYERLEREYGPHAERHERMAPYIAPSRVGITGVLATGDKITRGVYDSTTLMAAELMAHFVAGHVINPGQQWMGYAMRDPRVADDDETREWLEECTNITLTRMAASPFYAEGPESLIDWGGFGTGALIGEEAPQPINLTLRGFRGFYWSSIKTGRFLVQEGADGTVHTLFRRYQMTAGMIEERWKDNSQATLPQSVTAALSGGERDRPFKVIHGIYPRPKSDSGYGAKGMPWASCWVEYDSKHIIQESGYRVFPAAVPRHQRTDGDVYGRGRGDIAFPDTWTLNSAKRMSLEDWALKIRPPVLHRHDSVIGSLRLVPGGPTSINTHGQDIRQSVMPYQTGSNPEVAQINEENLRASIRQIFYIDHILKLLEIEKSEMTAFEYAQKINLLFKLIGPVYGRLQWEWLYRIGDIAWDAQMAARALPPPPPIVFQSDGNIDVIFDNPLARAQRSGDAESMAFALNDMAPLAQLKPQILDWVDDDAFAQGTMRIRGVPAKWTSSRKQVDAIRAARAEQDRTDLQLERAEKAAGAVGKLGPMMKTLPGGKQA